jgi:peptidoglycan/LPS O-acetylase OafA/YrhL
MESKNIAYLPWLNHLRFFGSILIVLYHGVQLIWHQQKNPDYFFRVYELSSFNPFKTFIFEGHTAVALFMVISGFVLVLGTYQKSIS